MGMKDICDHIGPISYTLFIIFTFLVAKWLYPACLQSGLDSGGNSQIERYPFQTSTSMHSNGGRVNNKVILWSSGCLLFKLNFGVLMMTIYDGITWNKLNRYSAVNVDQILEFHTNMWYFTDIHNQLIIISTSTLLL